MSKTRHAERASAPTPLYRCLRLVKLALGIAATALTIGRMLGLL